MRMRFLATLATVITVHASAMSMQASEQLYTPGQYKPSFSACAQLFPDNTPIDTSAISKKLKPIPLCSDNFANLYSGETKTPLIVIEKLNRAGLADASDEERTNDFFADPRLPKELRSELNDYKSSGYDRGHNSPAADQQTANAMAQSFSLSNMMPQDQTNNRKIWSRIESDTRKFARRAKGNVFVFTGPLFKDQVKTIGSNQVWVPTLLFKLVYDEANNRAWGYVIPNQSDVRVGPPMSYADFVKVSGWDVLKGKGIN